MFKMLINFYFNHVEQLYNDIGKNYNYRSDLDIYKLITVSLRMEWFMSKILVHVT